MALQRRLPKLLKDYSPKLMRPDPYLSLLEYQNTIIDNIATPEQLLMSQRLRSVLPITSQQLTPKMIDPRNVSI